MTRSVETAVAVPARVGLVGNPSDGYGGAVVAATVPELAAHVSVTSRSDPAVCVVDLDADARLHWPSADAFRADTAGGHRSEQRIITASLAEVMRHLGTDGAARGVEVRWRTDIPRSVGLAGSSALAVAVIRGVAAASSRSIDPRLVAALALAAEVDGLQILAGWQDRIAQTHPGCVLVDAAALDLIDGVRVPRVRSLHRARSVPCVVGWVPESAASSAGYHAALRSSSTSAADVQGGMAELGRVARRAAAELDDDDVDAFRTSVDEGWVLRQSIAPLRADHAALVEAVRSAGACATTPGSGGSVVALPPTEDDVAGVIRALDRFGARHLVTVIA